MNPKELTIRCSKDAWGTRFRFEIICDGTVIERGMILAPEDLNNWEWVGLMFEKVKTEFKHLWDEGVPQNLDEQRNENGCDS